MTFLTRAVTASDLPQVTALLRDVLAEYGLTFGVGSETDEQVLALPGSYEGHGGAFWVAVDADALLGTCGVFPVGAGAFELRKMYLAKQARGLGVGKALLAEARGFVKLAGGTKLVLDTTEQMTSAIRFYEAQGFVRDDAQVRGARCSRGYSLDV